MNIWGLEWEGSVCVCAHACVHTHIHVYVYTDFPWEIRTGEGIFKEIMAENFLELMKYLYPQIKEPSLPPHLNSKQYFPFPICTQIMRLLDLRAERICEMCLRGQITYWGIAGRLTATSLIITVEARIYWNSAERK